MTTKFRRVCARVAAALPAGPSRSSIVRIPHLASRARIGPRRRSAGAWPSRDARFAGRDSHGSARNRADLAGSGDGRVVARWRDGGRGGSDRRSTARPRVRLNPRRPLPRAEDDPRPCPLPPCERRADMTSGRRVVGGPGVGGRMAQDTGRPRRAILEVPTPGSHMEQRAGRGRSPAWPETGEGWSFPVHILTCTLHGILLQGVLASRERGVLYA